MKTLFVGSAGMENIQEKLDRLHDRLERLQVTLEMLPEQIVIALKSNGHPATASFKDVLPDDDEAVTRTPSANGKALSPEGQIQRLTAQLTAAYNRIAALEDQLMARRSL